MNSIPHLLLLLVAYISFFIYENVLSFIYLLRYKQIKISTWLLFRTPLILTNLFLLLLLLKLNPSFFQSAVNGNQLFLILFSVSAISLLIAIVEKDNYTSDEENPFLFRHQYTWIIPGWITWKNRKLGWAISWLINIALIISIFYIIGVKEFILRLGIIMVVIIFLVFFIGFLYLWARKREK